MKELHSEFLRQLLLKNSSYSCYPLRESQLKGSKSRRSHSWSPPTKNVWGKEECGNRFVIYEKRECMQERETQERRSMEWKRCTWTECTRGYFLFVWWSVERRRKREKEKEVKNSKQPSHECPQQTLMRRFVFFFSRLIFFNDFINFSFSSFGSALAVFLFFIYSTSKSSSPKNYSHWVLL